LTGVNRGLAAWVFLVSVAAHADCPTQQASCLLHEEGAVLLGGGHFEQAAAKFKASIAAAPSARAYLGYAQAIEGLGQLALAYETMLEAKRLSDLEVANARRGDDAVPRNERIKYKLAELSSAVAFVRLALPDGVTADRITSVQREHEGDVAAPFDHPIAVAPDHQVLVAMLSDGQKVEFEASVAAGFEGRLVIPIRAPETSEIVEPAPPPVEPRRDRDLGFAVELFALPGSVGNIGSGYGGGLRGELRRGPATVTLRVAYFTHPDNVVLLPAGAVGVPESVNVGGYDVQALVGARLAIWKPIFASFELGLQHYDEHSDDFVNPDGSRGGELGVTYGLLGVGVGAHWRRFDLHVTEQIGLALDDTGGFDHNVPDTVFRVLVSVGFLILP